MKMYSTNSDALATRMAGLLEEAGILEKQASDEMGTELDALASSLLVVADQLDQAGLEEAASYVDQAVSDVAQHLPKCPDCAVPEGNLSVEPSVIAQASVTTLIRLADRFDAIGHEKIARSIDGALTVLAGKKEKKDDSCPCGCKACKKGNKHCKKCGC